MRQPPLTRAARLALPGQQARDDLDGIWEYIARESRGDAAADRHIDAITDRFYLLARHPKIGRARDEDPGPRTWSFPVEDYVIVYDLDGEDVRMLRVAHGRRDLAALSRR
jgi:plasmid stabilization system protein ParE